MMLLAGDVGATKVDLAVFSTEAGPRAPHARAQYPSAAYPGLDRVVREFLAQASVAVDRAVFGVAGPVMGGRAAITNLSWVIDEADLGRALGLTSVVLLNDVEATASAVPLLEASDLQTIRSGDPVPGGAIAVIAPGTGLGEAFLTWDSVRYRAHPSEGGHADFAPSTPFELDLLRYLQGRVGHVSYERVCSGIGLPNIYTYLRDHEHMEEPDWLTQRLAASDDPTPVIVAAALDGERPCRLCRATLDAFVSILGGEAGNMALKVLATGGVYLAGGIPRRILPALAGNRFPEAFQRKGRMAPLLARVPVHVIIRDDAALLGAARRGLEI